MSDDISNVADGELPSTSLDTSSEKSTPKKGILKRPSWKSDTIESSDVPKGIKHRPSPDRFPEKETSRIPKLQVTWWEKNAVAFIGETSDENNTDSEQLMRDLGNGSRGSRELREKDDDAFVRQTAILDSEDSDFTEDRESVFSSMKYDRDIDETMSVTSSTGSTCSQVVGKWWNGKETRFIPHCQKKGCNHSNHNSVDYMTPTQRRNREMAQLKKELRQAISERDEKEKHLLSLRDKVKEIEVFNEAHLSLAERQKLVQKDYELRENVEKEKKALEKKHAVRVSQLIQETMSSREESIKLTTRIKDLEELLNVPKSESTTQTDPEPMQLIPPSLPPDPYDTTTSTNEELDGPSFLPIEKNPQIPYPSPMSVTTDTGNSLFCSQEALNHMQACQNEAFIWRTKAAQLEMIVKNQLLTIAKLEEKKHDKPNTIQTTEQIKEIFMNASVDVQDEKIIVLDQTPATQLIDECLSEKCRKKREQLIADHNNLKEIMEEGKTRINELEEDIMNLRRDIERTDNEKTRTEEKLAEAMEQIEEKEAEIAASMSTSNRIQNERDTLQKAVEYMDRRIQVYRNTLMDHDIVVSDEQREDWMKTISDPRYHVMTCQYVQTDLTSQKLSKDESEFLDVQKNLHELQKEFSDKKSSFADKFGAIEQILVMKTELVETLSKQIEDMRKQQREHLEKQQTERENNIKSLKEVGAIAETVPMLEMQLSALIKDKNDLEVRLEEQRDACEDGLSKALEEGLAKYKEQEEYWTKKNVSLESQNERLKKENGKLCREVEEQKMQNHLQKAELQRKLASSIGHVQQLQGGSNKPQRDVECQAQPRNINKYVACRPNMKSKGTEITKGDLFDEVEERLRVSQTELSTTRRQVSILQQKLVYFIQNQAEQKSRRLSTQLSKNSEGNEAPRKELDEVIEQNSELMKRVYELEAEKAVLGNQEKTRIQKLVNEFDNVRGKLNEYMELYSKEKQWLQWRIANLKKDNNELQQAVQQATSRGSDYPMRNAVSECDLEEIHEQEALEEHQEQRIALQVAAVDSDDIPNHVPFSNLAHVLNLVRSDLEQVLTEIEDTEKPSTGFGSRDDVTSVKSPNDILNDLLHEWDTDDRILLENQLRRSKDERQHLSGHNKKLMKELELANAELEVFRREKPERPNERRFISRSASFSDFKSSEGNSTTEELSKWQKKCGTLFREVNHLRKNMKTYIDTNKELKYQLTILRGDSELANCSKRNSVCLLSPSASFYTAPDENERFDELIVHPSAAPFEQGATKASISCSILVRTNSAENLTKSERRSKVRERSEKGRSRSASRKVHSSKDEMEKREMRRELRLPPRSGSLSSSVTSIVPLAMQINEEPSKNQMSQSWHESLPPVAKVVSLRDKLSVLTKQNNDLKEKVRYLEKRCKNEGNGKVFELEKETEELKRTVHELLKRVEANTDYEEKNEKLYLLEADLEKKQETLNALEEKLKELETERKQMYLEMFKKGQKTAQIEIEEGMSQEIQTPEKIALKFLNSALYHYFMNKGNPREHLTAIMGILGFTHNQQQECLKRLKIG